jgi:PAS domain S-box-containing protein
MKFKPGLSKSPLARYVLSIGFVVAAFFLYKAVDKLVGGNLPTYIMFYPAVIFTALFAGFGAVLLATAVAAMLAAQWIIPPDWLAASSLHETVGLVIFSFNGILIGVVAEFYQRSRLRAADYRAELAIRDERDKSERALRESEERLRFHVENSPMAVVEWDKNFIVTRWAGAAENMFGWSAEETVGKPIMDLHLIYEEDLPIVERVMAQLSDGATRHVVSANRNYTKDRRILHCEWYNSVLSDQAGKMASVMSLVLDITVRKQMEEAQKFMIECGYAEDDFFESLAHYLSQVLSMDYVCIDKLLGDKLTAQTVAIYFDGKFEDNVEYVLKDTPCGDVVGKSICCFPRDVRHLFPQDVVLQQMVAESYVGTTLWSSAGQAIGLIAVLSRKPLANPRLAETILKLVSIRAAGELERRQGEEILQDRTRQLEDSNKELASFSYSVSHDLRAPLRAIDGFSKMLAKSLYDKLSDEEKQRFDVIRDNTRKMDQLIDDLLAFSRLGRQKISSSVFNMEELVNQTWEELRIVADGRKIKLTIGDLPQAFGERGLMKQVLTNLLSNAIKFTKEREDATIEIGWSGKENIYFIKDNGVGFDMAYYHKLFGVFQRLHSNEEFEGTGVGLAIVQRIINRHGGRVWAEGKVNVGATFYFSLPKEVQ